MRSSSPSPSLQSFYSLQPQGKVLKFCWISILLFTSLPANCLANDDLRNDNEITLFSFSRLTELKLEGLIDCKESWEHIEDIERVFCCRRTDILGVVLS